MSNNKLFQKLRDLGLNDLESTIYIWLLENKRSTGYRIATQLNKPVANTYKALKSLEKKGAVISDNSSNNNYFDSINVEEFLNKLEREFKNTKDQIIEEANRLQVRSESGGIFAIQSTELTYEKAINMINTAEATLLLDCYPTPMIQLRESLKRKSSSSIPIFVKNYCDTKFNNINQIRSKNPALPIGDLGGEWLIVLKDTTEALVALFDKNSGKIKNSVWTKDSMLSFAMFNGSIFEFSYTEVFDKIYDNTDNKIEHVKDLISRQQEMFKFLFRRVKDI